MIYFAGPLFTSAERLFNLRLEAVLKEKIGVEIFLPQRECSELTVPEMIFSRCRDGVKNCRLVLAVLDGTDADSGTAWETGYAHGLGKPVIGLRTDFRQTGEDRGLNLMLSCGCEELVTVNALEHDDPFDSIADALVNALAKYTDIKPVK